MTNSIPADDDIIRVGDDVLIAYPCKFCGSKAGIGITYKVGELVMGEYYCGHKINREVVVLGIGDEKGNSGCQMHRLQKIRKFKQVSEQKQKQTQPEKVS